MAESETSSGSAPSAPARLKLAEDFAAASYADFVALAEEALKGAPFDKRLKTRTYEGIVLEPLYTPDHMPGDDPGWPGFSPFIRARTPAAGSVCGWDIRQRVRNPDPATANAAILDDLDQGATSVLLRFDRAFRAGLDPDRAGDLAGEDGIMAFTQADVARLLADVDLKTAAVALEAGARFDFAAALLMAHWQSSGIAETDARGHFAADPIAAFAATGTLPAPLDVMLGRLADLAAHALKTYPHVTAVEVSTDAYHAAGASEDWDLGCALSTGLAYLKAMTAAGLELADANRQIVLHLPVSCDQFMSIAKLRAARLVWSEMLKACGLDAEDTGVVIHAEAAHRIFSRRDPWVNMLRTTVTTFAAAVGGAEIITVPTYDAAIGLPDSFARRVARNTQVILMEESNLNQVIDPAGGSHYVETLTRQLAEAAWSRFQEIEAEGGIAAMLESGDLQGRLAALWAARAANLGTRKEPITGVSEFPNINEKPAGTAAPDLDSLRKAAAAALKPSDPPAPPAPADGRYLAALCAAALGGASIGRIAAHLDTAPGPKADPLPRHRLAEDFEALRDASDRHAVKSGSRPKVFLANLGRIAQHTVRAGFAKNFFEAGGIETVSNEGFADPEAMVAAFRNADTPLAILCGSDDQYPEAIPTFAPALKAAGCKLLFMAGHPGDQADAYKAAGVDDHIRLGSDVLAVLSAVHDTLGVDRI